MPRRQRGADISAAVRRVGSLSRGGNLRAGSGPPFPRPAFSPFVCVLLPPFLFLLSFASGSRFDQEKAQNMRGKTYQKQKRRKLHKIFGFSLRAQFSLIGTFHFPLLHAQVLARRPCLFLLALSALSPAASTWLQWSSIFRLV